MRQLALGILLFFGTCPVFAQTDNEPVKWTQEVNKISDSEYELVMKASIADKWHVYSQHTAEGGALPTAFTFKKVGVDYELLGETGESETHKAFNTVFEVEETFFKEKVEFRQSIKLIHPDVNQIDVYMSYQVCKEVCILGEQDFNFVLMEGN